MIVFSFYITLTGQVTIYILNKDQLDGEEDDGDFSHVIQYTKAGQLDRGKLGYCVTSLGKLTVGGLIIIGPLMITVIEDSRLLSRDLRSLSFYFSVCLSVIVSVKALYTTVMITQNCQSIS